MPVTIMPATMKHRDGNTFVAADCIKGDPGTPGSPGDPTLLIDDTTMSQSKTWSSSKTNTELGGKADKITGGTTGHLVSVGSGGAVADSGVSSTSQSAASGGSTLSLVTTGEKYGWNGKYDAPSTPGTDGTYILQRSVSSGTATDSWVSLPNASGVSF